MKYKIFELPREKTYENVESFLAEKDAEGWELVSLSTDVSKNLKGMVVIVMKKSAN